MGIVSKGRRDGKREKESRMRRGGVKKNNERIKRN
jgi:hypothetical protein